MRKVLLTTLLAGLCSTAYASDFSSSPYVGVSAGYSQVGIDHVNEEQGLNYSSSTSGTNVAIFAGLRWQNSEDLFIDTELKGRFLWDSDDYGYEYEIDAFTTSIGATVHVGKWLTSNVSLYGILGVNHNMIKYKDTDPEMNSDDVKFSYQSMELGFGSDLRLTDQISLVGRVTYDQPFNDHGNEYADIERSNLNVNAGIKLGF